MKLRKPPAIAAWLIARNSPLAGDLLEEFQRGKSRGWFWRQAIVAVAAGWGRNVRVSQLYLKAYFIGFTAHVAVAFVLRRFDMAHFGLFATLALLAATAVLKHKIAGSVGADLSRTLSECSEMESQKRIAISRLVALWAFTVYLYSGVMTQAFFFSFDVLRVVFCRPGITRASGKRP
jgi:hypothetical protein